MPEPRPTWTDQRVDEIIGNLLRTGVIIAALTVLAGGILYLDRFGHESMADRLHDELPKPLRNPLKIVPAALEFDPSALIQLGLLFLIATPVGRVAFSVFAFFRQRDATYVVVTLIVLAVLLYSLFSRHL
jgi:uncharacterized membrane protein